MIRTTETKYNLHFMPLITVVPPLFQGKAKWDSWNSKKGMDSNKAKEEYVAHVKKMIEKHGLA